MRKLSFLFLCTVFCLSLSAHSGKASYHVIIDTDGAADDFRAICMLLSNSEVEVLAITTSEGALMPAGAAQKVSSLLHHFHHEGIPVGVGRNLNITPPQWRKQSEQIAWGATEGIAAPSLPAKDLIIETLEDEDEKVVVICLGTLTNLNDALEANPGLKGDIDRVLWYNSHTESYTGSNHKADSQSVENILKSGIKVEIVSGGQMNIPVDNSYLEMMAQINNPYAGYIADVHQQTILKPVVASAHMKTWDDLVVVYLYTPEIFTTESIRPAVTLHKLREDALVKAKESIVSILTGKPDSENRVFYIFPQEPSLYAADVAPFIKEIVEKHGHKEWRAGVLTNELHGHLGIYAIIGVKMGIRAREYYNIGVDDIRIVSFAGSVPPISCMNDGLQVSTGGTLGHGLITVATDEAVRPEATFTFKNKGIRMKLKPQYAAQIGNDVREGIRLHGNLTEAYWKHIRQLAIKYWLEFDRYETFELTPIVND